MLKLKELKIVESKKELEALPEGKLLINTINAHSYNTALKDDFFAEALMCIFRSIPVHIPVAYKA